MDGVTGRGGNLFLGILAGLVAAIIGSAIWMGITVAMGGVHVGYVALGVGALVGFAIRYAGHGSSIVFGIFGAVFTLLSCFCGEVLSVLEKATSAQQGLLDLLKTADLVQVTGNIFAQTDLIMYLIYAIGIFEGYKLSRVK